ncbi:amino acid ABC transporter ATP-binding protein [Acetanaerobacterium elongatum]|uniref:Amino acid ABC transporter ATP-binding protein, PAAT family n=1 Tax=Acetanaerobacterium elongatum TaxID=258515 RepID=A0A1G9ZSX1_9FIRM|nr:amino acid ABC transporter ATP-binding protein [Acetanaerobacterium elongatum]SDN24519.1 amino acid ABC transporter ATP-binding protein, PAAT family [Acetanaerobacterium elongatum]
MNLLEMKNIGKAFDGLEVIKDISLSVEEGEVLGVIGPSGSGKSTLLRCATLLEKVDTGTILYKGETLVHTDEAGTAVYAPPADIKRIRSYFGLVFQNFNLFPHFSVLRNITEAPIHVAGQTKEQAVENARRLLRQMGLEDKEDAYPYQLSGGQQQRVSIARALALKPDILFFDEPTSALDPELTGEILKVIRELASERMTMVIITHEMGFARDVADHILFMDDGVIVEQGNAQELINNPQQERTKLFLNRFFNQ